MDVLQYIEFTSSLLSRMHVSTHIIKDPDERMSSDVDLGLRAMLFGVRDYSLLLANSPTEAKERVIYRFFDEYMCSYMFFKIPSVERAYFFVGPYIRSLPTERYYEKKAAALSLDESRISQLRDYYRNLPIVEDENLLFGIMDTLGTVVFGGENNFNIEYVNYEIPDQRRPVFVSELSDADNKAPGLTLEIIEANYGDEKLLMDAVSKGKLNKIDLIAAAVLNQGTEERVSDSLRNRKNYLIILNTLLRKAAEYGAVHPYHIHRLSSRFARKIEELYSIDESLELQREMMRKYCILVREHSLKKYSHLIGRVITLISYDLTADLSLKSIAATMNANPSYLSSTFKKECGETLTEYVNRKRMEHAAYILSHTDKQVQAVAQECGVLDVNYFIKLFKKQHGVTPTQYKDSILKA